MPSTWPSLKLKILLHYYAIPAMFPERSPAATRFEIELMNRGFIESSNGRYYATTNKGRRLVRRVLRAAMTEANALSRNAVGDAYERFAQKMLREVASGAGLTNADLAGLEAGEPVVMRTKWHYGIPYDVAEPAVVWKPHRRPAWYDAMHAPYGGRLFDYETQAAPRYEAPVMPDGTTPKQWESRYNFFKRLGTRFHEQGACTRREWAHVLDIVWARTDGLNNGLLARALYEALVPLSRLQARTTFDVLRRTAMNAHRPPPVPKEESSR